MPPITIKVKRIDNKFNDIQLPKYETEGSSGMDIRASVDTEMILEKGKIALVPTNLSVEIPEGYEIQVRPRSGLAAKNGIGILNSPGTIDSDYRGEIKIILFNFGDKDFVIKRGERIAQIIISKVYKADFLETDSLEETKRNTGGFGSSGKS